MARKRTKEEARDRIDDLPLLPPPNPVIPFTLSPQYRVLKLLERPAKELAKVFVTADPLGRLEDETTSSDRIEAATEAFEVLVNDPNIKMGAEELQMINDDNVEIVNTGNGRIPINGGNRFSSAIRTQFSRANSPLGRLMPDSPSKRTRTKTKTDKNMSKALAMANKQLRKKNGSLRKGVSQSDIMRRAHRLAKKMRSK